MSDSPFKSPQTAMPSPPAQPFAAIVLVRGIAGGIVGGVVGFFVFQWLARRGLYGMMIPGAMIGLGAGLAAGGRSVVLGVICAVAAIALSIYAEWAIAPFVKDPSFAFFLAHLNELRSLTLIMAAIGALFAFWLGQGR